MNSEPETMNAGDQPVWQQQLHLSKEHDASLTNQLRQSLVTAILDGHISHQRPLPPSRGLASQLGVARNTIVRVYQHLLEDGYLISQERRGYFVNLELLASRASQVSEPVKHSGCAPDWSQRLTTCIEASHKGTGSVSGPSARDWRNFDYAFATGQVDRALFPINEWRECCRQSLRAQAITDWSPDSIDRDDPLLIEQIQRQLLPRRGLWVDKDQILVTLGAQNALYLLATLLVNSGDCVGFEEPGHPEMRNILELCDSDIRPLPVDHDGLIVDERINDCSVVYCTPSNQAPTNATLSLQRRHELLRRASEHDFLIVEDDYENELNCSGDSIPALKSLDTNDRVIYVGSLSKTLAPGLRMGYVVGPKVLINEVRALRKLMLRHPPANNQNVVAHFLASGHHEALLQRLSLGYRERLQAIDGALKKYMPESVAGSLSGGSALWLKLPEQVDANEVARQAAKNGILVVSGDGYFMKPLVQQGHLRLGLSVIALDKIAPGIARLATLVNGLSGAVAKAKD